MPAKGTIDKFHGKHLFVNKALWNKYKEKTGEKISYAEFTDIIEASMLEVQNWVLKHPIGFQLAPKLGNIAINRFIPKDDFKAYINTPIGPIRNHNLHTGGNVYRVQWFHSLNTHESKQSFWFFKAIRSFNRTLATILKSGKGPSYNSYMQSHFVIKIER